MNHAWKATEKVTKSITCVAIAALFCGPGGSVLATAASGEMAESVRAADLPVQELPDFSYAGFRNGTAAPGIDVQTSFDVTEFGAVPDDGLDDSRLGGLALNGALRQALPGQGGGGHDNGARVFVRYVKEIHGPVFGAGCHDAKRAGRG